MADEEIQLGEREQVRTMRTTIGRATAIIEFLLIATTATLMVLAARPAAGQANEGPTRETALRTEKELAQAMRATTATASADYSTTIGLWLTVTADSRTTQGRGDRSAQQ
jgi:hypothetical protein